MVTYDAMSLLFQFGMFLITMATAVVAMIALYTKRKK
ncbi:MULTISPECIES: putative holin-like toxin [unclassified Sporosarcina]|nr:putative holin-like toxin [Sporosarcina sp. ZBG7A]